jgi:hypothetical protein
MTGFHVNLSLMTPGHFRHAWRLPHADPTGIHRLDHDGESFSVAGPLPVRLGLLAPAGVAA